MWLQAARTGWSTWREPAKAVHPSASFTLPRLLCLLGFCGGIASAVGPTAAATYTRSTLSKNCSFSDLTSIGTRSCLFLSPRSWCVCRLFFFFFLQAMCFLTKQFLIKSKVNTSKKRCPSARLNLGGCIANQTTVRCSTQTSPICLEKTSTLQSIMSHLVWRSQNSSS